VLAAFALWDAILTSCEPVPWALYLTAAPKLPLAIIWDFWLAWILLARTPLAGVTQAPIPANDLAMTEPRLQRSFAQR
jgi:hypothetical protein